MTVRGGARRLVRYVLIGLVAPAVNWQVEVAHAHGWELWVKLAILLLTVEWGCRVTVEQDATEAMELERRRWWNRTYGRPIK